MEPRGLSPPVARVLVYAAVFGLIQVLYHAISAVPTTSETLLLVAVGSLPASWLIGVLLRSVPVKPQSRLGLVWLSLFVVQMFADLIEGAFFTTRISSSSVFLGGTLVAVVMTFAESLAAVVAFPSQSGPASLFSLLGTYFGSRSAGSWAVRLALGVAAYFPVYFLFGGLVSPVVLPYYTDPSLGLGLTIPSFQAMTLVELLRGLLFVLALLPWIAATTLSRRGTWAFLTVFLYVVGAYIPFVAGTTLPWTLRAVHSVEIFADSAVYGAILAFIFKPS